MAELVPRVWGLCERAAQANINLTIDAEEVDRLELSLAVFEALAAQVARQQPQWLGLALQAYQTRALEAVEYISAIARRFALRLLCLHEAIADRVIDMLRGAVKALVLGDPADLATDVGPLIDREACDAIEQHLQRLVSASKQVFPDGGRAQGAIELIANPLPCLIAPWAFELARIADVAQKVFGPVLQIVRWRGEPQAVMAQINALAYGLTLGIQTRIDSRAQALAAHAHIGNVYVNRPQGRWPALPVPFLHRADSDGQHHGSRRQCGAAVRPVTRAQRGSVCLKLAGSSIVTCMPVATLAQGRQGV
jgi:hypothetical protein